MLESDCWKTEKFSSNSVSTARGELCGALFFLLLFIYVIALSGGIVLEEAVDLSSDRLLMNECNINECTYKKYI
jgi:hypothetical protein